MTSSDQNQGGGPQDEILAGEYVLGVLSSSARRLVEQRMAQDARFAQIVQRWQADLSGFNSDYEEQVPPGALFAQIERRLFRQVEQRSGFAQLWHSAVFWRSLSFVTSAVALVAVVYSATSITGTPQATPLVAELSAPGSSVNLLASYDTASGRLRMTPVAAGRPEEKSLELWLVPESGNPQSLGVLQPGIDGEMVVPADMRGRIGEGSTLAVTLEPFGGSPTGQATGPIVASGSARRL
jgi:anti-sigma-K factor RskA